MFATLQRMAGNAARGAWQATRLPAHKGSKGKALGCSQAASRSGMRPQRRCVLFLKAAGSVRFIVIAVEQSELTAQLITAPHQAVGQRALVQPCETQQQEKTGQHNLDVMPDIVAQHL